MQRTTIEERKAKGKAHRDVLSRGDLGKWRPPADRPDTVALLEATSADRLPTLVPLRYARMLPSPFTFLRGAAAAMAHDVGPAPNTGILVQLCGDCHLLNFGGYGTPERNFLFDIVDFDETLIGPFEWDVKRLAASVHVAGRTLGHTEPHCSAAVAALAASYRTRMGEFAPMRALDIWYSRIDEATLLAAEPAPERRHHVEAGILKLKARSGDQLIAKVTEKTAEGMRFRDEPPTWFHPTEHDFEDDIRAFFADYVSTLSYDRQVLLRRFEVRDFAMKVVGVGSVGTRCGVLLMEAGDQDYLLLQVKEARSSVWEQYTAASRHPHRGQRVVNGQRLMQAASDLFLGWASATNGRHFYIRQLRDMKGTINVETMTPDRLAHGAAMCGWALARAHARAGDPAVISGYLGKSDAFDQAMVAFGRAYADQTEKDHGTLVTAAKEGRLPTQEP